MKGEQTELSKAMRDVGKNQAEKAGDKYNKALDDAFAKELLPKNMIGMSDSMIEGIYGQAYRLYNTGKYKDAAQLFRLLVMLNSTEPKYTMGLAACFHMSKDYKTAINTYVLCGILDPHNPVPHYHASDCHLQRKDKISAIISLEMAIKRAKGKPEYKALLDRAQVTLEGLKQDVYKKDSGKKKKK